MAYVEHYYAKNENYIKILDPNWFLTDIAQKLT